jgi:hypothetical protein
MLAPRYVKIESKSCVFVGMANGQSFFVGIDIETDIVPRLDFFLNLLLFSGGVIPH